MYHVLQHHDSLTVVAEVGSYVKDKEDLKSGDEATFHKSINEVAVFSTHWDHNGNPRVIKFTLSKHDILKWAREIEYIESETYTGKYSQYDSSLPF